MLNRKTLLVIAFVLLFAVPALAQQGISVARTVSGPVEAGGEVAITLALSVSGEAPSSVIVVEDVPDGWQVMSSSPKASSFDGSIKWLLYGGSLSGEKTLSYTLRAPADFAGAQFLSGRWKTLSGTHPISGDGAVKLAAPAAPPAENGAPDTTSSDNTLLYAIGLIVILAIVAAVVVMARKKK